MESIVSNIIVSNITVVDDKLVLPIADHNLAKALKIYDTEDKPGILTVEPNSSDGEISRRRLAEILDGHGIFKHKPKKITADGKVVELSKDERIDVLISTFKIYNDIIYFDERTSIWNEENNVARGSTLIFNPDPFRDHVEMHINRDGRAYPHRLGQIGRNLFSTVTYFSGKPLPNEFRLKSYRADCGEDKIAGVFYDVTKVPDLLQTPLAVMSDAYRRSAEWLFSFEEIAVKACMRFCLEVVPIDYVEHMTSVYPIYFYAPINAEACD